MLKCLLIEKDKNKSQNGEEGMPQTFSDAFIACAFLQYNLLHLQIPLQNKNRFLWFLQFWTHGKIKLTLALLIFQRKELFIE